MIAVIMATWNRIDRLPITLKLLKNQSYDKYHFYICNNNKNKINDIEKYIINYDNIFLKNFNKNEGGFARFLIANEIKDNYKKIVFIDDDQIFENNFLYKLNEQFEEKTIKSWFSWNFLSDNYWHRNRIFDGSKVHYCGTGGMILDSEIFKYNNLYKIPDKFKFIEDLWICYFANHELNWNLKGLKDVNMKIITDGKDQYVKLANLKKEMLKYLIYEKCWNLF